MVNFIFISRPSFTVTFYREHVYFLYSEENNLATLKIILQEATHGDGSVIMCAYARRVSLTPSVLKSCTKQFGEPCPSCPQPSGPRTPLGDVHTPRPPSTSCPPHPATSGSCSCTRASHSRSKEILCKSTGSQRRQDSGQAWQGVCVNSSEQADFAQRGRSQQKAFPGQQRRAVCLLFLDSGQLSRTSCT